MFIYTCSRNSSAKFHSNQWKDELSFNWVELNCLFNVTINDISVIYKGETITRVNGNVSFTAGKRLQNF